MEGAYACSMKRISRCPRHEKTLTYQIIFSLPSLSPQNKTSIALQVVNPAIAANEIHFVF